MEFYEKVEPAGLNIMNMWKLHWSSEVRWSHCKKIKHLNTLKITVPWQMNLLMITCFTSDELNTQALGSKRRCFWMKNYECRRVIELTALFYGVHGIQFGPEVSSNKVRHGMSCRQFVWPCEKRPPALRFRLRLWFSDRAGLWVAHGGVRQYGWGGVPGPAVVFPTLHFVLELRKRWAGLLLHGEVKHAGCHVVPHKLDADFDTTPFFPLLSWFGLQRIPTAKRCGLFR